MRPSPASARESAAPRSARAPLDGACRRPARAVAEYVSLASPVYAEHLVDRIARRLDQARDFPESGRVVPEFARPEIRELIEWPYRLVYHVHAAAVGVVSVLHGRQELRELPQAAIVTPAD